MNKTTVYGINKTEGVCGGSACIGNTRISVYGLVELKKDGASDKFLLELYPVLTQWDLDNAWLYYDLFPEEIENDIRENEEA